MTTGQRIRQLRGDRTQQDVADAAGITVRTLRRIELGQNKGGIETIVAISRALGVSMDELFEEQSA